MPKLATPLLAMARLVYQPPMSGYKSIELTPIRNEFVHAPEEINDIAVV